MSEAAATGVYEDEFIKICETGITLHLYYFPYGSKTILWKELKNVHFMSGKGNYRGWGMGLSSIWWACDMGRPFTNRDLIVLEVNGGWVKKGASVQNAAAAIAAINRFAPSVPVIRPP